MWLCWFGIGICPDAAIVVISAGAGQKSGETRLDLVNKNVAIFKSIIPEIAKRNFAGIMLVVATAVNSWVLEMLKTLDIRAKITK